MAQNLDVRYVTFNTAGSSALKVAPAIPLKTLALPSRKKRKRITLYLDPVATAGIVMAAIMLILMAVGVSRLNRVRNSEAVMAAYVDTLQAENEALQAEFEAGFDLKEVEKNALALGMVPASQAEQGKIQVASPNTEEKSGALANFFTFLTKLFA